MQNERRIAIAIRVRPTINAAERSAMQAASRCESDPNTLLLTSATYTNTANGSNVASFQFDAVFDGDDDQHSVYEESCQELVDAALLGANATILAYGQTGSGKTHTILGAPGLGAAVGAAGRSETAVGPDTGFLLRIMADILHHTAVGARRTAPGQAPQPTVFVTISAIEVYMDDVFDLLNQRNKLRLRDTGDDAILTNLRCVTVNSLAEVLDVFSVANAQRSVASTKSNDVSSRSHACFFIDIYRIPGGAATPTVAGTGGNVQGLVDGDGRPTRPDVLRSRISLIDLAGSERVKKSEVSGQALSEAQHINSSLSALGTVINALHEGRSHIPFRDSNLTRLLRPTLLEARCRVLLIGHISPVHYSFEESLGTARFCDRVKNLKSSVIPNNIDPTIEAAVCVLRTTQMELQAELRVAQAAFAPPTAGGYAFHSVRLFRKHFADPKRKLFIPAPQRALLLNAECDQERTKHLALRDEQTAKESATSSSSLTELTNATVSDYRMRWQQLASELEGWQSGTYSEAADMALTEILKLCEATELQAKRAKKNRKHAEERRPLLIAQLAALDLEAAQVASAAPSAPRYSSTASHFDDDDDDEDGQKSSGGTKAPKRGNPAASHFDDDEPTGRTAGSDEDPEEVEKANHAILESFHNGWKTVADQYSIVTGLADKVAKKRRESRRQQSAVGVDTDSRRVVRDILYFLIDRSVDVAHQIVDARDSYAWLDIDGSSSRLMLGHQWHRAVLPGELGPTACDASPTYLSDDDAITRDDKAANPSHLNGASKEGATGVTATSGSAAPPTAITHEQATKNAKEKRKKLQTAPVTRKFESDEADKHYLMTVYDSPTLIVDVVKFLTQGTVLLKHGRNGAPHRRKVWVSNVGNVREIVWIDPDTFPNSKKASIPLVDVASVVLGPFSKVFRRNPVTPDKPEFFLSFTVTTKSESRTLDLVADSLVDFEAWVLGLSHLAKVDPVWGKALEYPPEDLALLTAVEKELCVKNLIPPKSLLGCKERVTAHRDEIAMHVRLFQGDTSQAYASVGGIHAPQLNHLGAVLVTKGELRYYCTPFKLDIFRVCAIWAYFSSIQLVYDPSFVPATNFHRTTAK